MAPGGDLQRQRQRPHRKTDDALIVSLDTGTRR
jgi:hypothetical protein